MANLSEHTRKEQVLLYLTERANQWVDGPELATEAVGGSEGLRRLRELRMSGDHDIRERRHPDAQRDIWQYMLVSGVKVLFQHSLQNLPKPLDLGVDFDDAKPAYPDPATEAARREEEAQRLLDLPEPEPTPSPWPADYGQPRISSAVKRKEDGTFEYVPPQRALIAEQLTIPDDPPQPPPIKFDARPSRIDWGSVAICPRCKSKTTRGRKAKKRDDNDPGLEPEHIRQRKSKSKDEGPALTDADGVLLFRDPHSRKAKPCERCNGYGIVPNQGPIALTVPTGPAAAEPTEEEALPERLDL